MRQAEQDSELIATIMTRHEQRRLACVTTVRGPERRQLRVGKLCAIAASLFDLRSETTEGAATVDTSCKEDALLAGIKALVRKLAGK